MCNLLRSVIALCPDDLLPTVYLCCNKVAPAFKGVEIGLGDATISKAVADATGCTMAQLRKQYAKCGDLGLVAEARRGKQRMLYKPKPLTVRE